MGDNKGDRPLHFAAGHPNMSCLCLLLSAGASPNTKNASGAEPLHFAIWQSMAHVQALTQAGASVTVQDSRGASTVEWACWYNKHVVGDHLIRAGANKDLADHLNGNPLLFSALTSQAYEFLEMLLWHNVDVLHINHTESTLLHWTARCADIRMLRVLQARKSQLQDLDTSYKDCLSRTAREVVNSTTCTEEFKNEVRPVSW
jgi:ankyrin repeat protein